MNFLNKFSKEDIERLKQISEISGLLKKKREKGLTAKFSSSKEKFFNFFCYGRYLAYFDGSPVLCSSPSR